MRRADSEAGPTSGGEPARPLRRAFLYRWDCAVCHEEQRRLVPVRGTRPLYCKRRACRDYVAALATVQRLQKRIVAEAPAIHKPKIIRRFRDDWRAMEPDSESLL